MTEADIRERLKAGTLSRDQALVQVEAELALQESSGMWNLRGDLIQLSEMDEHSLNDARESYERAIKLAPNDSEAYESLGHFYDAIEPDADLARRFYLEALSRGAGEKCRLALAELLGESGT